MFSSHPIKILTNISGKQCDNKRITINMKLVQYYSFAKNPTCTSSGAISLKVIGNLK